MVADLVQRGAQRARDFLVGQPVHEALEHLLLLVAEREAAHARDARLEERQRDAMHGQAHRQRAADHAIVDPLGAVALRREVHRDAQIEPRRRQAEDHAAVHRMRTQVPGQREHLAIAARVRDAFDVVEPPRDRKTALPNLREARIVLVQHALDIRLHEGRRREIAQQMRAYNAPPDHLVCAVAERAESDLSQARMALREIERRRVRFTGWNARAGKNVALDGVNFRRISGSGRDIRLRKPFDARCVVSMCHEAPTLSQYVNLPRHDLVFYL
ncbi:Exonuclease SbcC [Burkholderia vietnamiensis]|nr:Exonuclease SbcC [Burkholderia vietnamiensis]